VVVPLRAARQFAVPKTASVYSEIELKGFTGLNNKYSNIEIGDTESPDCLNVQFDAVGAISKRKGYKPAFSFPTDKKTIYSIIPYTGQSKTQLLITSGTSIWDATQNQAHTAAWGFYNIKQWSAFGKATWEDIETYTTPLLITDSLHANGARFSAALDSPHLKLYLVNGNSDDGLMSWDGTNLQKVVGAPTGKYLLYYKNHMYMAGDPNAPWRLYISEQGDPTTWPPLNYIDFPDGEGGITGMAQLGDSIVIFKERGVFILKGSDPSNYEVITTFSGQYGAVNHWSIVRIPNGLVYLARDGIWLFDGKKFTLLSDKISGSVKRWNDAQLENAVAFEYDHSYWISVPEGTGQTYNNYTYQYNYLYGWWTRHSIPMQACAIFEQDGEPIPLFTDQNGNLLQMDVGDTDNGNPIPAYFYTKAYDFGNPAHYKAFKGIQSTALAEAGAYNLTLSFIEDFGYQSKTISMPLGYSTPSLWGVFKWGVNVWGGLGESVHLTTNLPGQCRYLQLKLEQNDANAPFTFLSFVIRYKMKRRLA
jgi:hypothetical protein